MAILELYLVDGEEIAITDSMKPVCDGGGPLGHPREFLTLEGFGESVCKYCDRRFVHKDHPRVEEFRRKGQPLAAEYA